MEPDISPAQSQNARGPEALRHRTTILVGLVAMAGLLGGLQWRALTSAKDTHAVARRQLDQMRLDAAQVKALRRAPQSAASRTRPNEVLLGQVERALNSAGIDRARWRDSVPQAPVRLPQSDYKQLSTRLYFEGLSLKQLAAFTHDLQTSDPTLHLSALTLANRHPDTKVYDIETAVSYLVYAPQDRRSGADR